MESGGQFLLAECKMLNKARWIFCFNSLMYNGMRRPGEVWYDPHPGVILTSRRTITF